MSDRFYNQMLDATGWCPGYRSTYTLAEYKQNYKLKRKRNNFKKISKIYFVKNGSY